jgi:hypothetical protein
VNQMLGPGVKRHDVKFAFILPHHRSGGKHFFASHRRESPTRSRTGVARQPTAAGNEPRSRRTEPTQSHPRGWLFLLPPLLRYDTPPRPHNRPVTHADAAGLLDTCQPARRSGGVPGRPEGQPRVVVHLGTFGMGVERLLRSSKLAPGSNLPGR